MVKQLSADLNKACTGISGFSRSNLFAMRQMVLFFAPQSETVPQAVGLLPWGHIRVILAKVKDLAIADFYLRGTVEYGWVEIGSDEFSSSMVRALDIGGMVWKGKPSYPSLHEALKALDAGIAEFQKVRDVKQAGLALLDRHLRNQAGARN